MNPVLERSQPAEEDRARADCYALISRLFYAPPDADLLQRLAGGEAATDESGGRRAELQSGRDEDGPAVDGYAQAFELFRAECRFASPQLLREDFDDLFVGAGKALVTPYTAGYAVPHAPDRHLVALREQLAGWGLGRRDAVFEVEDHVSAVCDVMRWLIESNRSLAEQRDFFDQFVYSGVGPFCDAIDTHSTSSFYRAVSRLARAFLGVEKEAFSLYSEG